MICALTQNSEILWFHLDSNLWMVNAADSANESTESDDEFQICEICNGEEVTTLTGLDVR